MTNIEYLRCLDAEELEEFLINVYIGGFFEAKCGDRNFRYTADWLEAKFNGKDFWGIKQ